MRQNALLLLFFYNLFGLLYFFEDLSWHFLRLYVASRSRAVGESNRPYMDKSASTSVKVVLAAFKVWFQKLFPATRRKWNRQKKVRLLYKHGQLLWGWTITDATLTVCMFWRRHSSYGRGFGWIVMVGSLHHSHTHRRTHAMHLPQVLMNLAQRHSRAGVIRVHWYIKLNWVSTLGWNSGCVYC